MKIKNLILWLFFFTGIAPVQAYTNLTPDDVHDGLVNMDTLILLDVREVSEYRANHIAEPAGQLPLTPVNMPQNSGVLSRQYMRLPLNIDIIVYCGSGGRSISASQFLESKGYSRIYNMTGGFSSWTFERRGKGYGDHSGYWVSPFSVNPVVIPCSPASDMSYITISPTALSGPDSVYFELHNANDGQPIPLYMPESDVEAQFRLTALDPFGVPLFVSDSLVLADTVQLDLTPQYPDEPNQYTQHQLHFYMPGQGWRKASFLLNDAIFHREEPILRKWYHVSAFLSTAVRENARAENEFRLNVYPNPFNVATRISGPKNAPIRIYDIRGRFIEQLSTDVWAPRSSLSSGVYVILIQSADQRLSRQVLYLK